jgi:EAL domain-containing protein (putative c-di-GMP-specific phosphodiesterase class I)/GGDEF domain-containing protein
MTEREKSAPAAARSPPDSSLTGGFERLGRLANRWFDAPIVLVILADDHRLSFLCRIGLSASDARRIHAFHTEILDSRAFLVVDSTRDEARFRHAPAVTGTPHIGFFAGAPLMNRAGQVVGSFCIADVKPRTFSTTQLACLQDLAALTMTQIELQDAVGREHPITAMPNRQQFAVDLQALAQRHRGQTRALVVVEALNATLASELTSAVGLWTVEDLIRAFAQRLSETLGPGTRAYHVTTVRFAFILDGDSADRHEAMLRRLIDKLREPAQTGDVPYELAPRLGVATFELAAGAFPDCLRKALNAADQADAHDRPIAYYDEPTDTLERRRYALLAEIPNTLKTRGFQLVYQPKIDVHTAACASVEALLRWTHPSWGQIGPAEFMPHAANTSLIHPITGWVVRTAFEQLARWRDAGLETRIAVNASSRNLEGPELLQCILQASREFDIDPRMLELECTETEALTHSKSLRVLNGIRDLGVKICLDDFGTGYCNFSYLQEIPATALKLDQSLVKMITINSRDRRIVKSIISLAHDLGYMVTAEGVESKDVLDALKDLGCDEAQGYFISEPLPQDEATEWLAARARRDAD